VKLRQVKQTGGIKQIGERERQREKGLGREEVALVERGKWRKLFLPLSCDQNVRISGDVNYMEQ